MSVDGLSIEQLAAIAAFNPDHLLFRTADGTQEIRDNEVFDSESLTALPGISEHRLKELRSIGLTPTRSANQYFYRGRHVIAYFMGNLPAVVALEERQRIPPPDRR